MILNFIKVQCVSSSEPDGGTVSPLSTDSRQSPSTTVCEKGIVMSTAYQNTNIYKPTEAKIRRVQTPPQYQVVGGGGAAASNNGSTAATATHITGLTNLTLQQQQHNTVNNPQHHQADNGGSNKPDTHDSPQNSPTTTLMITPPPPRTPTPQQQLYQMDYQQQQLKTPSKNSNTKNRNRCLKTSPRVVNKSLELVDNTPVSPSSSSPPLAASLQRTFSVGELIWGPARGFPAWPGKVVKILDNQSESVWVQWFGGGGRSNTEIMAIHLLQSLSEGLEAHHKAQKDTRKSRKLNSQLEKAIQEAMTELDRISASSTTPTGSAKQIQQPTSSTPHQNSPNRANKRPIPRTGGYDLIAGLNNNTSSNIISTTTGSSQPRHKPIRIAPAPPGGAANNSPTKSSTSTNNINQINTPSSASAAK
ncbi:Methyl-CpG-binding domain protein 5 [Lucilia cuprina]|nr:Methyl-CpG-binding domain protein 5 [Lucilia cuprina]